MNTLQPDIIIASMARDREEQMELALTGPKDAIECASEKKGRTHAATQTFILASGKRGLVLTGGAGRKPMNAFSQEERFAIGQEVMARWKKMTS